MATTRIKDLSKTATTVNSDANLVLDGNTGGTQKISRDNFRQDTADAFVAAPGTYNLAPLNSGTGKIDAVYLSSTSDSPKGAWNASTNTPTLADGSGTAGDYYDVTVAGSSDLGSGSIAFTVGDVVKYNGTVWFKIDSVANILDGVSTIDGAKTAIEIPDVGTAPNEVPLNGMLGDMAYQSSDGVSMGTVEAESLTVEAGSASTDPILTTQAISGGSTITGLQVTAAGAVTMSQNLDLTGDEKAIKFHSWESGNQIERALIKADGDPSGAGFGGSLVIHTSDDGTFAERVRIDSSGKVGIGTASPGSKLTIDSGDIQLQANKATNVPVQSISWKNTNSTGFDIARIQANTGANIYEGELRFITKDSGGTMATRWSISPSGNLVANGTAIDFGSTNTRTGVTVSGSTLSHYEEGSWTPTIGTVHAGPTPGASAVYSGKYVRIGQLVHCSMDLDLDASGTSVAVDDRFTVGSLPLAVNPSLATYTGAGSCFIYLSSGAGNNAFGTVGVTTTGDSAICQITHIDGTVNWGNNLRAIFTYHTDA